MPIVLVGNKCDLMNDREVSTDEGRKLADRMKAVFLETSAKNNQASVSNCTGWLLTFETWVDIFLNYCA